MSDTRMNARRRAQTRTAKRRFYDRVRGLVNGLKEKPCADCGVQYPTYVMHFDRVRGRKKFTIGGLVCCCTRSELFREIDVVCANCHAERTHGGTR